MFDDPHAVTNFTFARTPNRAGPGAAWGKTANEGVKAPRPRVQDEEGYRPPARNSQAGALSRYYGTDDDLVLEQLAEQGKDAIQQDDGPIIFTSTVMLPPSVIKGTAYPWFAFKTRPFIYIASKTVMNLGRGDERVEFHPARSQLIHEDITFNGDDVFVGAMARGAMHREILEFLQGKEVEITLAWEPDDIRHITAKGVTRIRSVVR